MYNKKKKEQFHIHYSIQKEAVWTFLKHNFQKSDEKRQSLNLDQNVNETTQTQTDDQDVYANQWMMQRELEGIKTTTDIVHLYMGLEKAAHYYVNKKYDKRDGRNKCHVIVIHSPSNRKQIFV